MPMPSCLLPNHDFNIHHILFRSFIRELLFFVENTKKWKKLPFKQRSTVKYLLTVGLGVLLLFLL
jgi:hypothetical protein